MQQKLLPRRPPPPPQQLKPPSSLRLSPNHLLHKRKRKRAAQRHKSPPTTAPGVAVAAWQVTTVENNPHPQRTRPNLRQPQHRKLNQRPPWLNPLLPLHRPTAPAQKRIPNVINRAAGATGTATAVKTTRPIRDIPTTLRQLLTKTVTLPNDKMPIRAKTRNPPRRNPAKSTTKTIFWELSTASEYWK